MLWVFYVFKHHKVNNTKVYFLFDMNRRYSPCWKWSLPSHGPRLFLLCRSAVFSSGSPGSSVFSPSQPHCSQWGEGETWGTCFFPWMAEPSRCTHHFYLHLMGQNLDVIPYVAGIKNYKYSLKLLSRGSSKTFIIDSFRIHMGRPTSVYAIVIIVTIYIF